MATKQKAKNLFRKPTNTQRLFWLVIVLIIALAIAVQTFLFTELFRRTDEYSTERIKTIIIESVKDLNKDPAVDPQTGKNHIPEARLVLPPTKDVELQYSGDKDLVQASDRANVNGAATKVLNANSIEKVFENVPELQACSRQIVISFTDINLEDVEPVFIQKLADGRTASVYKNTKCQGDSSYLIEYLKQIQSY